MKTMQDMLQEAVVLLKGMEGKSLTPKDRLAIPQQDMPGQEAQIRSHNMEEVATGYLPQQAKVEATRCLHCKNAPCRQGCPVNIDIPAFITAIEEDDYQKSINIIKESSMLPAICGRVCPQEKQCMLYCTVGKTLKDVDKSVAIGRLERFVADWESAQPAGPVAAKAADTGKMVAIIGSGPSGLTAAADLARAGHRVEVFEAFQKEGGVTVYGIPEFRLPKVIVEREVNNLKAIGVQFHTDFLVGRTRTITDMLEKDRYDAVYIATGAGLPMFMNIPGENLIGVLSANEYLTRNNLMGAYKKENDTPIMPGKRVAVLGAGNVAMDAARSAIRLGAEKVYVVYRRTEKEMPARVEEVRHAREEGVEFIMLTQPKHIRGDEKGYVKAIECLKCELGEPDASGRRSPVEIPGSDVSIDVDLVIVAIGNASNPLIRMTTPGLECNKRGNIIINEDGKTGLDKVYAGGDIVLGAATVILAMGQGRVAAAAINKTLAA